MRKDKGSVTTNILVGLLSIIVIVAILVGGWQFGWWLKAKNVDRQTGIDNRQLGTQTAWVNEINRNMIDFAGLDADSPQRAAIKNQICTLAPKITDSFMTDKIAEFEARYCK